ncbi:hypothetical protein ACLOJK_026949 [Asimina triloba]
MARMRCWCVIVRSLASDRDVAAGEDNVGRRLPVAYGDAKPRSRAAVDFEHLPKIYYPDFRHHRLDRC